MEAPEITELSAAVRFTMIVEVIPLTFYFCGQKGNIKKKGPQNTQEETHNAVKDKSKSGRNMESAEQTQEARELKRESHCISVDSEVGCIEITTRNGERVNTPPKNIQ